MTNMKSKCHNAEMRVEGDTTKYNVCTKCEKACDGIINKTADEVVLENFILRPTTHVNAGNNKTEKAVSLTESQLKTIITQAHQQGEREERERIINLIDKTIKDGESTILAIQNGTKRNIIKALQQPLPDKE